MLADRAQKLRATASSAWVVAVPASRRSLAERGYNPAAEVARSLARRLRLPWRPEVLSRVVDGRCSWAWPNRPASERHECMPAMQPSPGALCW